MDFTWNDPQAFCRPYQAFIFEKPQKTHFRLAFLQWVFCGFFGLGFLRRPGFNIILYSPREVDKKLAEFFTYYSLIVCRDTISSNMIRNGLTFVIEEMVQGFPIFFRVIPKIIKFSDIVFLICQVQYKSERNPITIVGSGGN